MGTSASTARDEISEEQRELENLAASVGALPALRHAASVLSHPQTNEIPVDSLQKCLTTSYKNSITEAAMAKIPNSVLGLLDHIGSSITDLFFSSEKGKLDWVEFVKGYVNCCGGMAVSMRLTNLLRVFDVAATKSGLSVKLEFESDEDACKVNGYLLPSNIFAILLICWSMTWNTRCSKTCIKEKKATFYVPDIDNLVMSAVVACTEGGSSLDVWNCDIFSLDVQIPAGKFLTWALATIPGLPDCFSQFMLHSLQHSDSLELNEVETSSSSSGDTVAGTVSNSDLLTCGRAWAISLSFKSSISEEILGHCFPRNGDDINEDRIYCSSVHGKGMNRFWANVEGYHGPLLVLISAFCNNPDEGNSNSSSGKKWVIGALLQQGFENKDSFYGSSANLYAIDPLFSIFSASGKDKNFVYSHLHTTSRVYEARPTPVGIGFGGTLGNERIFMDEDFAKVTIRHHSVDKTYRHGPLFPDQGYLAVEATIVEVQVWGLGGNKAKEKQASHLKREELFTEQRRTVDLKTFGNWEDSPEKMMMDMVSNPNRVRRENR